MQDTTTSRRILLVEDQSIIALVTASRLSAEGYVVDVAHTGERAIEMVQSATEQGDPFGLVLMDIDLGRGIDGVEAARRILDRFAVPIVFLTGHTEPEYVNRVREVTRYGYVLKSSNPLILKLSIEMAMDLFAATTLTKSQESELEAIFDHAPLAMFVVDSDARVVKANRCARAVVGLTAAEARSSTLGCALACIHAVHDPERCGAIPQCLPCKLRDTVRDTLDNNRAHREVAVRIDRETRDGIVPCALSLSTQPLDYSGEHHVVVSIIDLDRMVQKRMDARRE